MTELAGRTLWDRFQECQAQGLGGIPRDELLQYLEETAEALDRMTQERHLQHLNIKPQTLLLVDGHIQVASSTLARELNGGHATFTCGVEPTYAAPELFDGIISRYCDQYSLAMFYQELLTGQRPFQGGSNQEMVLQHLQAVPDVSQLPDADQPVIVRALAKWSTARFPTCRDMVRLLRQNP